MTEKYPFFREADEQTKAVIGEDAIAADLNGTYQKPYAVLTQKRLYCKNELGNFIVGADKLLEANMARNTTTTGLLWAVFAIETLQAVMAGISLFSTWVNWRGAEGIDLFSFYAFDFIRLAVAATCLIGFLVTRKKYPKISTLLLCIAPAVQIVSVTYYIIRNYEGWSVISAFLNYFFSDKTWTFSRFIPTVLLVVAIILCVISVTNSKGKEWFEIRHSTGTFTFSPKQYPAGELKNFEQQVKALQAGGANGR